MAENLKSFTTFLIITKINNDTYSFNLPFGNTFEPDTFADFDLASNVKQRCSITGNAFFLADSLVDYRCKLQRTVALSITKSELYSACNAAKSIKYMRIVLNYLGFKQSNSSTIHEDNLATIVISNNERAKKRLRHVDIRHFALLEWV